MSPFQLALQFFLQMAVILTVCHVVGVIGRRFLGQPQVVSEMIAGVLLGPSLFGLYLPEIQQALFPAETISTIYVVSQIGLVLYMFLVGLEFDINLIAKRASSAIFVSLSGIVVPFTLGCLLALYLSQGTIFFTPGVTILEAMLFVGASMSITAFPMLARIIYENNLAGTRLGTLALAAGSIDDAAAWCVLAIVLASFSGDASIAYKAIGGGILFAVLMVTIGRRLLARVYATTQSEISSRQLTGVLIVVMLSAWFTDSIGIYAVFGAFITGIAMPRGNFAKKLQGLLEPLVTNFLLPLFFVYSGLRTLINFIDTSYLWMVTGLVVLAATLGKGVACWLAARLTGENNANAMTIGVLMNARGLMELIILNIGLDHGLITPVFFTIMVMMAIISTLAASPIFNWIFKHYRLGDGRLETTALEFDKVV